MKKIDSKMIEEQGYTMNMRMERDAKSKVIRVALLLEGEEQGRCERTIIGTYLIRNITRKEYLKDLGDIIPAFGIYLNARASKDEKDMVDAVKQEAEQIHKQIEDYCLNHEAKTGKTECNVHEACDRVIEYVRTHNNPEYWWIEKNECIVLYDRTNEVLGLVDCGWHERREFAEALLVNGYIRAGKDGRLQRKSEGKWVLRIKIREEMADAE